MSFNESMIVLCLFDLGFSISEWYKDLSLTPGSVLSPSYLSILKENLGIADFLLPKEKQCNRKSADYVPQTENQDGWKIGQSF